MTKMVVSLRYVFLLSRRLQPGRYAII